MAENYKIKLQLRDGRIFTSTQQSEIPDPLSPERFLFMYNIKPGNPTRTVNFGANGSGVVNGATYADLADGTTSFTIVAKDRYQRGIIVNTIVNQISGVYITNGDNERVLWYASAHPTDVSFEENKQINAIEIAVKLATKSPWTSNVYTTISQDLQVSPSTSYGWLPYNDEIDKSPIFTATPSDKGSSTGPLTTGRFHYSPGQLFNKNGMIISGGSLNVDIGGQNVLWVYANANFLLTEDGVAYDLEALSNSVVKKQITNVISGKIDFGVVAGTTTGTASLLSAIKRGDTSALSIKGGTGYFVKFAEATMI